GRVEQGLALLATEAFEEALDQESGEGVLLGKEERRVGGLFGEERLRVEATLQEPAGGPQDAVRERGRPAAASRPKQRHRFVHGGGARHASQEQDLEQRQPESEERGQIDIGESPRGSRLDESIERPSAAQHTVDEPSGQASFALVPDVDVRQEDLAATALA